MLAITPMHWQFYLSAVSQLTEPVIHQTRLHIITWSHACLRAYTANKARCSESGWSPTSWIWFSWTHPDMITVSCTHNSIIICLHAYALESLHVPMSGMVSADGHGFAEFEQHTSGFGSRMLQQMGFRVSCLCFTVPLDSKSTRQSPKPKNAFSEISRTRFNTGQK